MLRNSRQTSTASWQTHSSNILSFKLLWWTCKQTVPNLNIQHTVSNISFHLTYPVSTLISAHVLVVISGPEVDFTSYCICELTSQLQTFLLWASFYDINATATTTKKTWLIIPLCQWYSIHEVNNEKQTYWKVSYTWCNKISRSMKVLTANRVQYKIYHKYIVLRFRNYIQVKLLTKMC